MILSLEMMRAKRACMPGRDWWADVFGEGDVDYVSALELLVGAGRIAWARWLLQVIGPTEDRISITGHKPYLVHPGHVTATGLVVDTLVLIGGDLDADDVSAGGLVSVGGHLRAQSVTADSVIANRSIVVVGRLSCLAARSNGEVTAGTVACSDVTPWALGRIKPPRR